MHASIAYFVTPHGYGHATRTAAVMGSLQALETDIRFELFSTVPAWLFKDLPPLNLGYHSLVTDIGMVQKSPWAEDPQATCRLLDNWLPFEPARLDHVADQLTALNCKLVVSDISPMGIVAAQRAGLPALVVENFTWDWIYRSYQSAAPGLQRHADHLAAIYAKADDHIQAQPLCRSVAGARQVSPISRKPRTSRNQIRQHLNLPQAAKMVLVSTGGVPDTYDFLDHLPTKLDYHLVIPGAGGTQARHPQVITLPAHSELYHPDLVCAADVLIGKLGYSTISEAYHAGTPFGYITRPFFPESAKLEAFVQRHMPVKAIDSQTYANGSWLKALPDLLSISRTPHDTENGADMVAAYIRQRYL